IKEGERVAIMGRNGSGKTTLIKLLSGLYMPTQGSLTYNKLPIEQINKNIYRKKLAVVLQDFQLFSGSIKDNILMGREWIEENEIETALESSGTKNFLHMIPGGIESKLSDRGQSLSTGQRQSIALARALVGRPEILVLDESTSALDLNAEKDFLNNLDLSMLKTLILVTHRLPMLELVDRIIILADGAIALDGKKEDVLKQLRT
ncbi:MAG: ATP-binding cassette domain-containing protein, partial [Gammaproteobacteria bacterium]|nr:ATP-binding cassette domain-containing protein [Gammaproteobacteria bacterium]